MTISCRPELVKDHRRLGIAFTKVENDPSVWQDDSAYLRFAGYFKDHAAALRQALAKEVPPLAELDDPEILLTSRAQVEMPAFLWVVNNAAIHLEPGQMWASRA